MNKPLVSICIITYNQQNFIRQCIEGALMQKVRFHFEIIVNDDNSTDETFNICKQIENENPNIVKCYQNKNNLGMIGNWIAAFNRCEAKYIAICEGDDYWTNPDKIQKQVEFLESNPDYSLCFHNAVFFKKDSLHGPYNPSGIKSTLTFKDFISFYGNMIPTAAIVMRNNFSSEIQKLLIGKPVADWYIQAYQIQQGNFFYIDECLSVYRIHETGVWSTLQERKKLLIFYRFYKDLLEWISKKNSDKSNSIIIKRFLKNIMFDLFRFSNPCIKYFNKYYLLYVRYKYL